MAEGGEEGSGESLLLATDTSPVAIAELFRVGGERVAKLGSDVTLCVHSFKQGELNHTPAIRAAAEGGGSGAGLVLSGVRGAWERKKGVHSVLIGGEAAQAQTQLFLASVELLAHLGDATDKVAPLLRVLSTLPPARAARLAVLHFTAEGKLQGVQVDAVGVGEPRGAAPEGLADAGLGD
eukprot:Hpha_TRINITY_DN16018_c3_g5::TRINITY_DN16018_c3_g5_i1::g.118208::m.118208